MNFPVIHIQLLTVGNDKPEKTPIFKTSNNLLMPVKRSVYHTRILVALLRRDYKTLSITDYSNGPITTRAHASFEARCCGSYCSEAGCCPFN